MSSKYTAEYIKSITEKFNSGQAKEHAYRPALQKLFSDITALNVINDPKRSEYGAPDFLFMKGKVAAAYAEAKDIGVSLDETEKGEQLTRYFGYSNLILTDCLEFRFFRNGQKYETVKIAEIKNGDIITDENNFAHLEDTIKEFISVAKEPIKSGAILAKVMAGKARRIRDNIKQFLKDGDAQANESLLSVYNVIKKLLLADLDHEKFADMYAQTVVYGLFAARYHDDTPDTFSRQEARDLVPVSNPFLRHFFDHIAGPSFDKRIEFIVNELCEEFVHADIQAIVHDYYKVEKTDSRDPIIHFYEDFLQEYDSTERKKMGVFYTPLPVVRFIVRALDDILKKEFGLKGLADSSKVEITGVSQGKKFKQNVHKVQILDPATGTGTFLNEVISYIKKSFVGQEGRWANYAREDLLPRLHGFEIMMASYTIAHLKLTTTLKESGADINKGRLGVYLTNSLEKAERHDDTLFSFGLGQAITDESVAANKVKNDLPIMVVLGNPPYSGVSSNETCYANSLVDKYKVEPGGKQKLQERKHWLNDDYVKFIAFAENMIEKNGEGMVGFITNHGYLDNPTFRGMRWHLMSTFDSIYIVDLHGNSKKKEVSPDGSKDENIFNIQQGVAIIIAVKNNTKKKGDSAVVKHHDVWGKRNSKFEYLDNIVLQNIKWNILESRAPNLIFVPEGSAESNKEYEEGFSVDALFVEKATGIVTARDGLVISENRDELLNRIKIFCDSNATDTEIRQKFFPNKKDGKYKAGDSRGWKLAESRKLVCALNHEDQIKLIIYRPFDTEYIYYHPKMVDWGREKLMKNFTGGENTGLIFTRQAIGGDEYSHVMVSKYMSDNRVFFSNKGIPIEAPLYIYAGDDVKVPNLKKEIVKEIEKIVGPVTPENLLDYIYAVLHSPSYREKYKEFLKIDFPRVPYPKDKKQFFALATLGEELRHLHLLESPKVNNFITTYPVAGDNLMEKINYQNEKVFINKTQYFGGVPQSAWDFYIGGYQPAQKWLKDRKGRQLTNTDIEHYQKIIVVLTETGRVIGEIDVAI